MAPKDRALYLSVSAWQIQREISVTVTDSLNIAPTDRDICDGRDEHGTYKSDICDGRFEHGIYIEISVTDGLNMAHTERDICDGRFEHGIYI